MAGLNIYFCNCKKSALAENNPTEINDAKFNTQLSVKISLHSHLASTYITAIFDPLSSFPNYQGHAYVPREVHPYSAPSPPWAYAIPRVIGNKIDNYKCSLTDAVK